MPRLFVLFPIYLKLHELSFLGHHFSESKINDDGRFIFANDDIACMVVAFVVVFLEPTDDLLRFLVIVQGKDFPLNVLLKFYSLVIDSQGFCPWKILLVFFLDLAIKTAFLVRLFVCLAAAVFLLLLLTEIELNDDIADPIDATTMTNVLGILIFPVPDALGTDLEFVFIEI